MPIIPDFFDSIVYVYPSEEAAEKNENLGGSGFVVGRSREGDNGTGQLYIVTNRHVIEGVSHPAIRINTHGGGVKVQPTNGNRWVFHPDGDDLAILSPLFEDEQAIRVKGIPTSMFMDKEKMSRCQIIAGDEVFMIGRFVSLDGTESNTPICRFGNIARLNGEPILNKFGSSQESFLIDCRSIPGYSGSPVFVTLWPPNPRPPLWFAPVNPVYRPDWHGPFLLGMDWLHIQNYEQVEELNSDGRWAQVIPGRRVKANTGMAGVIPAWRLYDLIEQRETDSR